jgi:hypothetical protein
MSTQILAQSPPSATLRTDSDTVRAFFERIVLPGEVHEVRIPNTKRGPARLFGTASGYFDNPASVAAALTRLTGDDAEAVYVTLNPVNPELIARANNRLVSKAKVTTGDADIVRRGALLIDVDPVRPAGISATDEERDAALDRRDAIRAYLADHHGWSGPLAITMSGNGGGLIYTIDEPNDAPTRDLIDAVLTSLAHLFDDHAVTVDTTVSNAARITKIPGTVAAKGDDTERRPWRQSTAKFPGDAETVSRDQLQSVARIAPPSAPPTTGPRFNGTGERSWTIEDVLRLNHLPVEPTLKSYATVYELDRCLTSADHTDGAVIMEMSSGALDYKCHHNRCQGKDWNYLREHNLIRTPTSDAGPSFGFDNQTHAQPTGDAPPVPVPPSWPAPLDKAAYWGLAGEIVRTIEPETEADPLALLVTLLSAVGNMVGSDPHWRVGLRPHGLRVNPVFVGQTSKARKGTSWGAIKPILKIADETWMGSRVTSGLSSGEGLLFPVRDEMRKTEPVKEKGRIVGYQEVVTDPGIQDKRLYVIEEEFSGTLKVMAREGNSLSAMIRQAWDDGDLRTMTKNTPLSATGAHITIGGHTTRDELLRYLTNTESGNGFANRFIWLCVKRSKLLPHGGNMNPQDVVDMADQLRAVLDVAGQIGLIERDAGANAVWEAVYATLSEGGIGLFGAITSRAEAQVMRLAAIYAVLDESNIITEDHLLAALAIWDYAEASARFIFGDATGDPVADAILTALRQSGEMSQTDISTVIFGRHQSASRIQQALTLLASEGKVASRQDKETGGRPVTRWQAV